MSNKVIQSQAQYSTQSSTIGLKKFEPYGAALIHLLPLLYVAFVLALVPIGGILGLDSDEGINLMKSWLYAEGYDLYREIWSDQPPLFTVLLAAWWNVWGMSMASSRVLVLGFAALLLWCFGQIVRRTAGIWPALVGMLVLINTRYFIKLSVSVMIGLPAIALALLSVYLLLKTFDQLPGPVLGSKAIAILSGLCFACSLQTKLFTVFLLPLIGIALLFPHLCGLGGEQPAKGSRQLRLFTLLLWLTSLGIGYLFWGLLFQTSSQIVEPHTAARVSDYYRNSSFHSIGYLLRNTFGHDYLFYVLGLVGGLCLLWQRRALFPLLWLLTALLLLANHLPLWYHHGLLLSVPLAWLSAWAVKYAVDSRRWLLRGLVGLLLLGSLVVESLHFWPDRDHFAQKLEQQEAQEQVVAVLRRHQAQTRWLLTDAPLFAFHSRILVPPPMAVPSYKRFRIGAFSAEDLLATLQDYQPEQILLSKFSFMATEPGPLRDFIQEHYRLNYQDAETGVFCWIHNSL